MSKGMGYQPPQQQLSRIEGSLVAVGVALAVAGFITGLRMWLHATVVQCENGHEFPPGTTDFRCFGHLHAGVGAGLTVTSALLGILVVLAAIVISNLRAIRFPAPTIDISAG